LARKVTNWHRPSFVIPSTAFKVVNVSGANSHTPVTNACRCRLLMHTNWCLLNNNPLRLNAYLAAAVAELQYPSKEF
jgi:hypothetical protein